MNFDLVVLRKHIRDGTIVLYSTAQASQLIAWGFLLRAAGLWAGVDKTLALLRETVKI